MNLLRNNRNRQAQRKGKKKRDKNDKSTSTWPVRALLRLWKHLHIYFYMVWGCGSMENSCLIFIISFAFMLTLWERQIRRLTLGSFRE